MVIDATSNHTTTVSEAELSQQVYRRSWYVTNIIIWAFLFIYPFFSILDLIFAPYVWQSLLMIRLITVLIVYVVYELARKRRLDHRLPLHIMFATVSVTYAVLCNIVDLSAVSTYFLTLSVIFLLINSVIYWESTNSYLHTALAIILLLLGYYTLNQRYPLATFFEEGGQIFLVVALFSGYIPRTRYRLLWKETRLQLITQQANQQLQGLNEELSDKNRVISETNGQLQRLNEQKNNFIYIAGHDLKNLVGTIKMSVGELQTESWSFSNDQREYVEYIGDATQRIQYLLNKLLDVKDIEGPAISFNYEVFEINQEIEKIVHNLEEVAAQKSITLSYDPSTIPISLRLDRVFAGQIFQNLINNAIKFSQPTNTLTLQTTLADNLFVFELTDRGKAIGQDRLDEMFGKLDELSHNNVNSPDRAGLGLSIALRLTEAMNGHLYYRSSPETGNYYRVEFPSV